MPPEEYTTTHAATPPLEELRITIDAVAHFLDAEPDAEHPTPLEDARELITDAVVTMAAVEQQHAAILTVMKNLAAAAARIIEDDDKPTMVHMRELNRCRIAACDILCPPAENPEA